MSKILFVNPVIKNCGIYQHGLSVIKLLKRSKRFDFLYSEIGESADLLAEIEKTGCCAVIFNGNDFLLQWLDRTTLAKITQVKIKILHTVSQEIVDRLIDIDYDFYLTDDPTILLRNKIVFKYGRILQPRLVSENVKNDQGIVNVGTFGLCMPNKGIESLVYNVQKQFDKANLKLHLPIPQFEGGDNYAHELKRNCYGIVEKKGINLEFSHELLSKDLIVKKLAMNDINCFLYEEDRGNGRELSGVFEYAIAANKPLAISSSKMFRHFLYHYPQKALFDRYSIREIIDFGIRYQDHFYQIWSDERFLFSIESAIESMLNLNRRSNLTSRLKHYTKRAIEKYTCFELPVGTSFLQDMTFEDNIKILGSDRIKIPNSLVFNLSYCEMLRPISEQMKLISPCLYAKKIPESIPQFAITLHFLNQLLINTPNKVHKILCVGSYDDIVLNILRKMGYMIDECDPNFDYNLENFRKMEPDSKYTIIFSNSVLERVSNEPAFIECLEELLDDDGVLSITFDYKEDWMEGDELTPSNLRFYNQQSILNVFNMYAPKLKLYGDHDFSSGENFFMHEGVNYTFCHCAFLK